MIPDTPCKKKPLLLQTPLTAPANIISGNPTRLRQIRARPGLCRRCGVCAWVDLDARVGNGCRERRQVPGAGVSGQAGRVREEAARMGELQGKSIQSKRCREPGQAPGTQRSALRGLTTGTSRKSPGSTVCREFLNKTTPKSIALCCHHALAALNNTGDKILFPPQTSQTEF